MANTYRRHKICTTTIPQLDNVCGLAGADMLYNITESNDTLSIIGMMFEIINWIYFRISWQNR